MEVSAVTGGSSASTVALILAFIAVVSLFTREKVASTVLRSETAFLLYRASLAFALLITIIVSLPVLYSLGGPVRIEAGQGQLVLLMSPSDLDVLRQWALPAGILDVGLGIAYYAIMILYLKVRFKSILAYLRAGDIREARNEAYDMFNRPFSSSTIFILALSYFTWLAHVVAGNSVVVDGLVVLSAESIKQAVTATKLAFLGMTATTLTLALLVATPSVAVVVAILKIEQSRRRQKTRIPGASHSIPLKKHSTSL